MNFLLRMVLVVLSLTVSIIARTNAYALIDKCNGFFKKRSCHSRNDEPLSATTMRNNFEDQTSTLGTTARRTKRNKYENFSKTMEKDPFETLLEESEMMNREIIIEKEKKRNERRDLIQVAPLPRLKFPNTQEIDPYDPQTFGYMQIAVIVGAHGVHGWLKVHCTSDFPIQRLCQPGIRHVKPAQKRAPRQMVLLSGRHRHKDEYLVQLEGVESRDAALRLRGAVLYVREEQLRQDASSSHEQGEYSVDELVGLDVFLFDEGEVYGKEKNRERQFVGNVRGVVFAEDVCSVPGLGHDYLEIVLPRGIFGTESFRDEMVLIPLVPQIVPHVDLTRKVVYIDPPNGLLDLKYVRQEKTRIKGFLPSSEP